MITKKEIIEHAQKCAKKKSGLLLKKYACDISCNPYDRHHRYHVIWHNAFYDARKKG